MSRQYLKVTVTLVILPKTYYYPADTFTLEEALTDAERANPGYIVKYEGKEEA